MFVLISYINLCMLLAVSMCHIVLGSIYYNQCPASPALTLTLLITGIIGVVLGTLGLLTHYYDAYDGSNKLNLIGTGIIVIYLIGSRIATSIMIFRLASRSQVSVDCAPVLYWVSTLLVIVSYSTVIISCCVLFNLILLQRRHNTYHKSADNGTSVSEF